MKFRLCAPILLSTIVFGTVQAQSSYQNSAPETRPRIVTVRSQEPEPVRPGSNQVSTNNQIGGIVRLRARIDEAERLLRSRPEKTAYLASSNSLTSVTLAALEPNQSRIHLISIPKDLFLKRGTQLDLTTSYNSAVTLRVIRANGVNTAVTVVDQNGRNFTPLVVQYPIERGGRLAEMGYYTSVHPALVSPDVVAAGQAYLHNMLDMSVKRLRSKGSPVSAQIVAIAERLCIVEHSDHTRFNGENRGELFNEIYSLYALNEGDTYRFSVSSAGAGGIAQMIPSTYAMIRNAHPNAGLMPDFIGGMRNHANALDAMLLYMQDTWDLLSGNQDVQNAMERGHASVTELLAAGYNSNPAKLPKYLRDGGSGWRNLIPHETQLYLMIYKSLESYRPAKRS